MKNDKIKRSLDDIAFEGRNKEYGAYLLRKTYQTRLFRSFVYSLSGFLIIILSFAKIIRLHSQEYYDNSVQGATVVGVSLSNNPYNMTSMAPAGGASSAADEMPRDIVADEEFNTSTAQSDSPTNGSSDSTGTKGKGSGTEGVGDLSTKGGGLEGEIYGSADINPQFPGGIKAQQQFINENLHYPESARRSNIHGTILVYAVIASDGSMRDIKVVKGLQPELDEEAIRVVMAMPLWKPAMRKAIPVNVRCYIPISVSPLK
ncbi:MAG: energy transducer TonB [Bacteroidota bacterium]